MSSSLPLLDDVASTLSVYSVQVSKYYQLASSVVLLYDYLLTFDLEVNNIWKRRWTAATVLFSLIRYIPLISYFWAVYSLHQTTWSPSTCQGFLHFPLIMTVITDTFICCIVILRIYALYFRQIWIVVLLAALASTQLAFEAWSIAGVTLVDPPTGVSGCLITVKDSYENRFAVLWGMSVIFDTAVFLLTLRQTLALREKGRAGGSTTPLLDMLLRDGIFYFAVMFCAKLINFVVFWTISRELITINWTFNLTITIIMITRLMLNLRAESTSASVGSSAAHTKSSSMLFARPEPFEQIALRARPHTTTREWVYSSVIGNLGETLDVRSSEEGRSVPEDETDILDEVPERDEEQVIGDGSSVYSLGVCKAI